MKPEDAEIAAIASINAILLPLDISAAKRVLAFFTDRLASMELRLQRQLQHPHFEMIAPTPDTSDGDQPCKE